MAPRARKPRRFKSCKDLSFLKKAPRGAFFVFYAVSLTADFPRGQRFQFPESIAAMTTTPPKTFALQPDEVVAFWLDAGPAQWFSKSAQFDADFRARFEDAHMAAAARRLDAWLDEPAGAIALMILLDQFPRNAYRDTGHMFATDALALHFAERAIAAGHDLAVDPSLRQFFYMPFEHAENLAAQNRAIALMEPLGAEAVRWAVLHRDIIKRFGRFPHRNAALARQTTQAEREFLESGGFAG